MPGTVDANEHAADHIRFTTEPHHWHERGWLIAWGEQLDIRPVRVPGGGQISDEIVAGYLATYAAKSSGSAQEARGGAEVMPRCCTSLLYQLLGGVLAITCTRLTCINSGPDDAESEHRHRGGWAPTADAFGQVTAGVTGVARQARRRWAANSRGTVKVTDARAWLVEATGIAVA